MVVTKIIEHSRKYPERQTRIKLHVRLDWRSISKADAYQGANDANHPWH